ncbi:MAG: transporter substrate-binding domain-containing protein [Oscillospiraceae bacterium]|nr:transporter substrate-binding domain-containing protein [Oscillospiraceae bacterium]
MKAIAVHIMSITLCLCAVIGLSSCAVQQPQAQSTDMNDIVSFRDIPGITNAEIEEIEALVSSREKFTYGSAAPSVEAFALSNGDYAGFSAGFCDLLSELFGIPFVLELYTWDVLKNGIDTETIDFTGELTPTPEREREGFYVMTAPIAERGISVYSHSLRVKTAADLNGHKAGVYKGSITAQSIFALYTDLSFEVVEVTSNLDAYEKMLNGEIDVFLTDANDSLQYSDLTHHNNIFPLVYDSVSMATANQGLRPVISAVNKYISAGGIDKLNELYKAGNYDYAKDKFFKSLSPEEAAYVNDLAENNKKIPIALENNNYPICFYNEKEEEYQGIAIDVLSEITALTGIEFENLCDPDEVWGVTLAKLASGEYAMVTELLFTEERKGQFLWPDYPYAVNWYALLSRSDYPYLEAYQVIRASVGVVNDTAYEEVYRALFPNSDNLIGYDYSWQTFDALESGEIDLVMTSEYEYLILINYLEKPGFKINLAFSSPLVESIFGFNINEDTLCSIISKATGLIDTDKIEKDWVNRSFDYERKLADEQSYYANQRAVILLVFSVVLVFLIIVLIVTFHNNRKAEREKSKQIEDAHNSLVAANERIIDAVTKLESVVENHPGIIWCVDVNENITIMNGMFLKKLGVAPERIIGKTLADVPPHIMHPEIIDNIRKTFTAGAQEWVSKTEMGTFHLRTSPIYDDGGDVISVVGSIDDITEIILLQDKLRDALKEANEANKLKNIAIDSMENILNSIDAMIYTTVPETGEILFVNDYMKEAFGRKDENLIGEYCYKIFRDIDKMCEFCPCFNLHDDSDPVIIWDEYLPNIGRNMRHSDCLINWPNGEKVHLQHAIDITELVNARELAEQDNRAKGIFLAHMSHEIRTPMNAILGMAEIQLQKKIHSPETKEAFNLIYDSGSMLNKIIDDILDLSKIEAGKLQIIPAEYNVLSLVSDTAQINRLRYENKAIEFKMRVEENTLIKLIGDELRIRQILNNLLSNAFKYTDTGEIELYAATEHIPDSETATLVFRVSDTGQGMTDEQISRLFDEYARFNMQRNQGIAGTGLGMSITKRLIDMMNGELSVDSIPGTGTVFTLSLPQKIGGTDKCEAGINENIENIDFHSAAKSEKINITHEYMPYGKVLIVDDVKSNLFVAKGLMKPYGLNIDTVESGLEAIEKIESGIIYDIIFMDHMMPKMNGIDATKILRDRGYTHPIVALTANAIVGQAEMFLENGFNGFISKPIDVRELDYFLKDLIRDKKSAETVEAARSEQRKEAETGRLTELKTKVENISSTDYQ